MVNPDRLNRLASICAEAACVRKQLRRKHKPVGTRERLAEKKAPSSHADNLTLRVVGARGNHVIPRTEDLEDSRNLHRIVCTIAVDCDELISLRDLKARTESRTDAAVVWMPDHLVRKTIHGSGDRLRRTIRGAVVHENNFENSGRAERLPERLQSLTQLGDARRFVVTGNQQTCTMFHWPMP